MGTILLQRHFGASRHGVILFGQGEFNWVLGDEKDVVYISKGNLKNQAENFLTRQYCTQRMRESNPLHPEVHTVGSTPWPYAIGDTFCGVPFRKFLSQRLQPDPDQSGLTSTELCSLVGNYLRTAFQHAPPHFGELTFRNGVAEGLHSSWNEHSADLLKPWLTPTENQLKERGRLQEIFPALGDVKSYCTVGYFRAMHGSAVLTALLKMHAERPLGTCFERSCLRTMSAFS